jgi:hypothetical protein
MLALFAPEGRVHSPLQGERRATDFYRALFATTKESRVEILDVYEDPGAGAAARLRYTWTLTGGAHVFECMDVFRYDAQGHILELRIYYDPQGIRQDYDAAVKATHGSPSHS